MRISDWSSDVCSSDLLPWSNVAHVWTKSEGSPSADGRYWCFMADTDPFNIRGVFTYDLQTQSVIGARSLSSRPDHVSMSPSGRYCVISGGDVSEIGRATCRERVCQYVLISGVALSLKQIN